MTRARGAHDRFLQTRGAPRRSGAGEDPLPVAEALADLSDHFGLGPVGAVRVIFGRWEQIVGVAIAEHVRPLHLEGDTIVVGADHPAWATQIRQLAPEILRRLGDVCGDDDAPKQLRVRVLR